MGIDVLDHRGARLLDFDCELRIGERADIQRVGIVPAHGPVKRVFPPAQSLVGEFRLHDVVEQRAVLPVAGRMVVSHGDDVGRVVPVDGRHDPVDGTGDEGAPGDVVVLEDDEIDSSIHAETPKRKAPRQAVPAAAK